MDRKLALVPDDSSPHGTLPFCTTIVSQPSQSLDQPAGSW
jgi:hypothetical protein